MWENTPIVKDGKEVILITGDANSGETGWIVAEMPYPTDEKLRLEQEKRAMMISGLPIAYKVLQDIREDALAMGTLAGRSIVLQAERALAYMPWLDEETECDYDCTCAHDMGNCAHDCIHCLDSYDEVNDKEE